MGFSNALKSVGFYKRVEGSGKGDTEGRSVARLECLTTNLLGGTNYLPSGPR